MSHISVIFPEITIPTFFQFQFANTMLGNKNIRVVFLRCDRECYAIETLVQISYCFYASWTGSFTGLLWFRIATKKHRSVSRSCQRIDSRICQEERLSHGIICWRWGDNLWIYLMKTSIMNLLSTPSRDTPLTSHPSAGDPILISHFPPSHQ